MTKLIEELMNNNVVESHYMVRLSNLNTLIVDFSVYDKGIITIITQEKYDEGTYILFDYKEFDLALEGKIKLSESLSDGYYRWTVELDENVKHLEIKVVKGTQLA